MLYITILIFISFLVYNFKKISYETRTSISVVGFLLGLILMVPLSIILSSVVPRIKVKDETILRRVYSLNTTNINSLPFVYGETPKYSRVFLARQNDQLINLYYYQRISEDYLTVKEYEGDFEYPRLEEVCTFYRNSYFITPVSYESIGSRKYILHLPKDNVRVKLVGYDN